MSNFDNFDISCYTDDITKRIAQGLEELIDASKLKMFYGNGKNMISFLACGEELPIKKNMDRFKGIFGYSQGSCTLNECETQGVIESIAFDYVSRDCSYSECMEAISSEVRRLFKMPACDDNTVVDIEDTKIALMVEYIIDSVYNNIIDTIYAQAIFANPSLNIPTIANGSGSLAQMQAVATTNDTLVTITATEAQDGETLLAKYKEGILLAPKLIQQKGELWVTRASAIKIASAISASGGFNGICCEDKTQGLSIDNLYISNVAGKNGQTKVVYDEAWDDFLAEMVEQGYWTESPDAFAVFMIPEAQNYLSACTYNKGSIKSELRGLPVMVNAFTKDPESITRKAVVEAKVNLGSKFVGDVVYFQDERYIPFAG